MSAVGWQTADETPPSEPTRGISLWTWGIVIAHARTNTRTHVSTHATLPLSLSAGVSYLGPGLAVHGSGVLTQMSCWFPSGRKQIILFNKIYHHPGEGWTWAETQIQGMIHFRFGILPLARSFYSTVCAGSTVSTEVVLKLQKHVRGARYISGDRKGESNKWKSRGRENNIR